MYLAYLPLSKDFEGRLWPFSTVFPTELQSEQTHLEHLLAFYQPVVKPIGMFPKAKANLSPHVFSPEQPCLFPRAGVFQKLIELIPKQEGLTLKNLLSLAPVQ